MDDATQKRHRENAAENVRRGFGRVAYLPSSETVDLLDALEAAQRPPVNGGRVILSVDELIGAFEDHFLAIQSDEDEEYVLAGLRALEHLVFEAVAAKSPVYDEEKIARWLHNWARGTPGEPPEFIQNLAAALVDALRGGELTREEANE